MMNALSSVCGSETIICVCMDKKQKIQTDIYQRFERQLVGKRKFPAAGYVPLALKSSNRHFQMAAVFAVGGWSAGLRI